MLRRPWTQGMRPWTLARTDGWMDGRQTGTYSWLESRDRGALLILIYFSGVEIICFVISCLGDCNKCQMRADMHAARHSPRGANIISRWRDVNTL